MIRASTCQRGNAAVRRLVLYFALCLAAVAARGQLVIGPEIETAVAQVHYLAGTKLLDGGRVEEAVHEFEFALQLDGEEAWHETADGATRNDYFPRRELGVAYFKLGRLDEAEKLLRDSLAVKDTARAHSYLDRVLAQRTARGAATDSRPPEIRTSIDTLSLTNAETLEFKVYVSDDTGVGLVTVNGQELYQRGSARTLLLDHRITPNDGDQIVHVKAWDLDGKVSAHEVTVRVDRTGPVLGISSPADTTVTSAPNERLIGSAADNDELASVTVNGDALPLQREGKVSRFDTELALAPGSNEFIIEAKDRAGNSTMTSVDITRTAGDAAQAGVAGREFQGLVAAVDRGGTPR